MKQIISLIALLAASVGIFYAIKSLFNKKNKEDIDDLIYGEDFDECDDEDEDGSYFDVYVNEDEGINLKEEE
ncbi:MAG: hypothetical protein ACRCZK_07050 [Oscillospiraceae bacterium]